MLTSGISFIFLDGSECFCTTRMVNVASVQPPEDIFSAFQAYFQLPTSSYHDSVF